MAKSTASHPKSFLHQHDVLQLSSSRMDFPPRRGHDAVVPATIAYCLHNGRHGRSIRPGVEHAVPYFVHLNKEQRGSPILQSPRTMISVER